MIFHSTISLLYKQIVTVCLIMLIIDVCNLLIDIAKLHVIFIHLIIVDDFIDFLHPLVIHEHAVIAL